MEKQIEALRDAFINHRDDILWRRTHGPKDDPKWELVCQDLNFRATIMNDFAIVLTDALTKKPQGDDNENTDLPRRSLHPNASTDGPGLPTAQQQGGD